MALSSFIRDTAYFQSRRDQQMMINAEDFDLQFNALVTYINDKVTPIIDSLTEQKIPGTNEENLANTFFYNIGDGSTKWAYINNNAIDDYAVGYTKLIKADAGTIFASGQDRIFKAVTPTDSNQALTSTADNLPVWQKLCAENFADEAILGNHIEYASIGADLLSPTVTGRAIDDNSILVDHISDNSITGAKFADSSITVDQIDPALILERNAKINSGNINTKQFTILDQSLENRHFIDNFLKFNVFKQRANSELDDTVNYTFTSDNIINNSLSSAIINFNYTVDTTRSFANGAITTDHIIDHTAEFNIAGITGYPRIKKEKLNQAIRTALGI